MKLNNSSALNVDSGFSIPCPTKIPSLKGLVSAEEWAVRVQLAATYRLCAIRLDGFSFYSYFRAFTK
jgi:hypothetical protein